MNFEYYIAKRFNSDKENKSTISSPITKIAILAVALGMMMMIVALGTGIGLQEKIRDKVSALNGHIIISSFTDNQSDISVVPIDKNQSFYPKFKSIPEVVHIQGVATKSGMIRTEKAFEGIIYKGIGKDYNWEMMQDFLVSGRFPDVKKQLNNEIVISKYLANRLTLKLGDSFNTFFMKDDQNSLPSSRRFTIVGVYDSGFEEFDKNYILGDIRHLQRINKWNENQIGNFEVFVKDFSKIDATNEKVYKEISSSLNATPITKKYYYIFDWIALFDSNILLILVVMNIVSIINMIVALLVIILEKIPAIGILKSLGATNWQIRKTFLYNAFFIILKGMFYGNLIGITLLLVQYYFGIIKLNPQNYYVTTAPVVINVLHILALNALVLGIGILALIIPSYIVTRITPAKSIKFT